MDAPLVLPADQQQANEEMLSRLPIQPDHLPFLPPPHLYKTTPVRFLIRCLKRQLQANHREKVYEEKENNTEVRVRETRLVESSLRNLIRATTSAAASSTSRRSTQQQDSQQQASTSTATAGDDAPAVTTDTATTPAPEDKENVDDLISLDLLARSNMDDTLDASVVNWKSGRAVQSLAPRLAYATAVANSRKRASQAGGDPGAGSGPEREGAGGARAKKIRWRLAA